MYDIFMGMLDRFLLQKRINKCRFLIARFPNSKHRGGTVNVKRDCMYDIFMGMLDRFLLQKRININKNVSFSYCS